MIYKIEIDDHSFVEAESCSIDKYVQIHIVEGFINNRDKLVKNIINIQLDERMCRNLIKGLRFSLDDLND